MPSATLAVVKPLRLGLVLILAVLLPVRGALAAAMLCAPTVTAGAIELRHEAGGATHDHHAVEHDPSVLAGAQAGPRPGGHEHAGSPPCTHDASAHDSCNVCSASCSAVPLPSASSAIDDPVALSSISFPDLAARAPTFQSDGQERPPRTC